MATQVLRGVSLGGRRSTRNTEPKKQQATRVAEAKKELTTILQDPEHPLFFATDSELRDRTGLSEPVIRGLRAELGVLKRDDRIFQHLLPFRPETMFLDEMVLKLGGRVDYHCLYHILRKRGVDYPRRNR